MNVLEKLSTTLGRRDELPNHELAKQIIKSEDAKAVSDLVANLSHTDKDIQSDCIKVLYEIGEQKPELIEDYDKQFLKLLDSKNNRMVWGAMTALDTITSINPKGIYKHITKILDVAEKGSVITKDHAVNILIRLAAHKTFHDDAMILLVEQLKTAANNQLPMYAENAEPVVSEKYKTTIIKTLSKRLGEIEKESKRKRVEKVIKKLGKK